MSTEAIKLLIIDDDMAIRLSFSDYFEDQGFEIQQADSGEQALELFPAFKPDVAIVDIRMAGMSGDSFIRRALQFNYGCNFIICTGSPDYGTPIDLIGETNVCSEIFTKPVTDLNHLKQVVEDMAS